MDQLGASKQQLPSLGINLKRNKLVGVPQTLPGLSEDEVWGGILALGHLVRVQEISLTSSLWGFETLAAGQPQGANSQNHISPVLSRGQVLILS